MANTYEKLKKYKTFAELSPEAAEKAIRSTELFTTNTLWGKTMDPQKVNLLFYPDGRATKLFVYNRE